MTYTPLEFAMGSILLTVCTASIMSSSLTLYLIHKIGRWNGYLVIIYSMTVCQIVYDSSFYFFVGFTNKSVYQYIQFSTSIGGISVTLWSNVLSGIVLYIVFYHQSVDIWKHYWKYFAICIVPSTVFAVCMVVFWDKLDAFSYAYNVIRMLSVCFNVLVYVSVSTKLYSKSIQQSVAVGPLRELSSRLKYYPICQVVTRIPACFYQLYYGFSTATFVTTARASPWECTRSSLPLRALVTSSCFW